MNKIGDFSDPNLRRLLKKRQAAVIPVGSIEQHGPHLPVSTDSDIVTEVAKRVAKKCNFLLLPTITYGISFEHAPFFNLSLGEKTLQKVLTDLCASLAQNKVYTIIILNGHHGNQDALRGLDGKTLGGSGRKTKVFVFSYWHFMKQEFDHAGFVETSLMLAISDKVDMKNAKMGLDVHKLAPKQREKVARLAATRFIKATRNGVWGDPTKATKRDGNAILAQIVQNIAKTVSKLA